jgi:hypothetical protein
VEVKIGVQNVAREITLESDQTPEQVSETVREALADGGLLSLTDDKGRLVLVPVASIGYVDVGAAEKGRVGFGTL